VSPSLRQYVLDIGAELPRRPGLRHQALKGGDVLSAKRTRDERRHREEFEFTALAKESLRFCPKAIWKPADSTCSARTSILIAMLSIVIFCRNCVAGGWVVSSPLLLARRLALVALAFLIAGMTGRLPGQTLPALATVGAVRTLTPDQARQARPVRLTGVVTALSGWKNSFFAEDSTAGISVHRTDNADVKIGDRVEVTGVSNAGLFAPVILASYVRVVGHVPLPPARRVKYSDTFGGQEDSQRIEVEGVVHSARFSKLFEHDILLLKVELGGGEMTAMLQTFAGIDSGRLIDSTVRVRGVCSISFTQKRQFVGLAMFIPNPGDIDIVQPANVDPFAVSATPLGSILQFGQAPHRVKVAGFVTYQIPGHELYLQNGHDGIRIQSSSNELVGAGMRVEVVGFPAAGDYAPTLKDGIFRVAGSANPIKPLRINARDVIANKGGFFQESFCVRQRISSFWSMPRG